MVRRAVFTRCRSARPREISKRLASSVSFGLTLRPSMRRIREKADSFSRYTSGSPMVVPSAAAAAGAGVLVGFLGV